MPLRFAFHSDIAENFEYFLELWFLCDLVLCFHVSYRSGLSGLIITDLSKIRRKYLKSFFLLDFASSIPTNYIAFVFPNANKMILLRVLRLLKLFRLMKLMHMETSVVSKTSPALERCVLECSSGL